MLHVSPQYLVTDDGCGTKLRSGATSQSTQAADTLNAQSTDTFNTQSLGQRSTQLHRTARWSAHVGGSTEPSQAIAGPW
jgi:hypothetical protein